MIGYEYNDGGRKAAGYKGEAGDCVARAISILMTNGVPTAESYRAAYSTVADYEVTRRVKRGKRVARVARTARNGSDILSKPAQLAAMGIQKVALGKGARPTWTEAYRTYGNCIVSTAKHVAAIVNGRLMDTHDVRTYIWEEEDWGEEERERKAMSVYIPA